VARFVVPGMPHHVTRIRRATRSNKGCGCGRPNSCASCPSCGTRKHGNSFRKIPTHSSANGLRGRYSKLRLSRRTINVSAESHHVSRRALITFDGTFDTRTSTRRGCPQSSPRSPSADCPRPMPAVRGRHSTHPMVGCMRSGCYDRGASLSGRWDLPTVPTGGPSGAGFL
jgi:hypothetical protein